MKICIHCGKRNSSESEYFCNANCKKRVRIKLQKHNNRAAERNISGRIYIQDWIGILIKCGFACEHCGAKNGEMEHHRLSIDHRQPLSKGGLNTKENISCLCVKCHRKKDRFNER